MSATMDYPILSQLITLQQRPATFEAGEPLFWNDPHISTQMLLAHLDPTIDAASRIPETIDRSVQWIMDVLALKTGDAVLDLGCGPGLYASRFSRAGLNVTGVDYSLNSIEYAKQYASETKLNIDYRYQNYLELNDEERYNAVFLIFGDFCPLNPQQRETLLKNVSRSLKPGGKFVLDVTTREHRKKHGNQNRWYATEHGFWKPGAHLVLEAGFDFPEQSIWLDQYTVIEADGKISVYRNWFQDYTPETVTEELAQGGFSVESLWADLTGTPYSPASEWIGILASKK